VLRGDVDFVATYRFATVCGGMCVVHDYGTYTEQWCFDPSGKLEGATTTEGEVTCLAGGRTVSGAWGHSCSSNEASSSACLEACPQGACTPTTLILADVPVSLEQARQTQLWVCRDTLCAATAVLTGLELGQEVPLPITTGLDAASAWFGPGRASGLALHLTWTLFSEDPDRRDFAEQEHYSAWLEDSVPDQPKVPLFDADISYELLDFACAGTCRVADVDLRAPVPDGP
jgi:hypothetical protein